MKPLLGSFLIFLALAPGCDKPLDPAEYGEILHGLPKIEGTSGQYPLPKLDNRANDEAK